MESKDILKVAAKSLDAKKAQNIKIIKVGNLTIIADYFIIADGTSSTQVKALAEEVENKLAELGLEPHHIEGRSTTWILLDYGSVIVHVFHAKEREVYSLERLWQDGERVELDSILE